MTRSNKSKIELLAEQTTEADMSAPPQEESPLPEGLFPPVARRVVLNPTAPAPQQPTPGQPARRPTDPAPQVQMQVKPLVEGRRLSANPIEGGPDAPALDDEIKAMLIMTGLRAAWSMNFWRVYLPEASSIVAHLGGSNRKRWQTGVGAKASHADWMAEINRFWKDVHPGEALPFGQG